MRALVERAEGWARDLGLRRIHTEASVTARPFFERQGFHVLGEERVQRNGHCFLRFRMRKVLA